MISPSFDPISLIEKDAYALLVSGNPGLILGSPICTFGGMGFFLYRGRVPFKGCSGASGSEA
jgi:hypothetical protein